MKAFLFEKIGDYETEYPEGVVTRNIPRVVILAFNEEEANWFLDKANPNSYDYSLVATIDKTTMIEVKSITQ